MSLIVVFAALFNLSCRIRGPEKLDGVVYNVDQNDIPVPLGFQRKPNSSWSYGHQFSKPFRSWKSTYLGESKPRKVASWYMDQMPKEGWLLKSNFTGSKRILTYLKGTEEVAEIEIYNEYFPNEDTFKTIVVAAIRPLSTPELHIEDVLEENSRPVTTTRAIPASVQEEDAQGGLITDDE